MPNLTLEGLDVETVEPSKNTHGGYRPGAGRKRKLMTPEQIEDAAMRIVDFMTLSGRLPDSEQFSRLVATIDKLTAKPVPTVGDGVMAQANAKEVPGVKSNSRKLPPPGDVGFDGETIDPLRDDARLNRQMRLVWEALTNPFGGYKMGEWWPLEGLAAYASGSEAGVSARLRDLRKPKYGSWDVQRKRFPGSNGWWGYRLNPKQYAERVAQHQAAEDAKRLRQHPTGSGKALPLPGFENLGG